MSGLAFLRRRHDWPTPEESDGWPDGPGEPLQIQAQQHDGCQLVFRIVLPDAAGSLFIPLHALTDAAKATAEDRR